MRNQRAKNRSLLVGILLLSACLGAGSAWAQTPCDTAYEQANRIYSDNWIQWQALFEQAGSPKLQAYHNVVRHARAARACLSTADTDRLRRMYSREMYGLIALGRYDEAFAAFDQFTRELPPDSLWTPFMYRFRAQADVWTGRLALAASHQTTAIRYSSGQSAQARAELYYDLGRIYQRMQDFTSGLTYFRHAASLLELNRNESAFHTLIEAKALHQISDIILDRSSYEREWRDSLAQAVHSVDRALTLYERVGPSREWAGALILRGDLAHKMGDARSALKYISRAEDMARRIEHHGMLVLAGVNRSHVLTSQARWRETEEVLLDALRLVDAERMDVDHRRRVLINLASVYEQWGRLTDAERAYQELIDLVEGLRSRLGMTEWSLSAFSRWQLSAYRGLVRVLLRQEQYEKAFLTLERSRARHASDLLSARATVSRLAPEERARYEHLTRELAAVRTRLLQEPYGTAAYIRLLDEETRLVAARGATLTPPVNDTAFTLETVQLTLAERGQTLISYFVDNPKAGQESVSHAFIITPDTLLAVPLKEASSSAIEHTVRSISGALSNSPEGLRLSDRQFSLRALHALYERVFEPLEPYLEENARLIIVPGGPLFGLPFGALVDDDVPENSYRTAPYLIRRFSITYEPGAALLMVQPPQVHDREHQIVAFGRTRYDADTSLTARLPLAVRDELTVGQNLPAVREEISSVAGLFWKSRAVFNDAATESTLYAVMANTQVLHIASHVVVDESTPMMSAILLSDAHAESDDGVVYFHELVGHSLAADLVVLSGCKTARGAYRSGEGSLGLHYGFRTMGAASSVSTLWYVDDKATAQLMREFYRQLRRGLPKDEALRHAQLTYLAEAGPNILSPYFWAAPVLYGHPEPVRLQGRYAGLPFIGWCVLALVGIMVTSVGYFAYSYRGKIDSRYPSVPL